MGGDRGVERRREDPLVLGEQVVGELVEVADPADHRGRRRRPGRQSAASSRQQRGVLGVALDEAVARVVVVRLGQPAVLREVVETDDLVAGLEQLRDEIAVDEPGGAGDEDPHQSRMPSPRAPHTSTTSLPPTCRLAVGRVRRAEDEDVALARGRSRGSSRRSSWTYGSVQRTRAPAQDEELAQLVAERRPGVVRLGLERHAEDADRLALQRRRSGARAPTRCRRAGPR